MCIENVITDRGVIDENPFVISQSFYEVEKVNKTELHRTVADAVVVNGNIEALEWIIEKGQLKYTDDIFFLAIKHGHIKILDVLLKHGRINSIQEAYNIAASNGNLAIFIWIYLFGRGTLVSDEWMFHVDKFRLKGEILGTELHLKLLERATGRPEIIEYLKTLKVDKDEAFLDCYDNIMFDHFEIFKKIERTISNQVSSDNSYNEGTCLHSGPMSQPGNMKQTVNHKIMPEYTLSRLNKKRQYHDRKYTIMKRRLKARIYIKPLNRISIANLLN